MHLKGCEEYYDGSQWLNSTIHEEVTRDSMVLDADGVPYQMSKMNKIGFDLTKRKSNE